MAKFVVRTYHPKDKGLIGPFPPQKAEKQGEQTKIPLCCELFLEECFLIFFKTIPHAAFKQDCKNRRLEVVRQGCEIDYIARMGFIEWVGNLHGLFVVI